MTPKQNKLYRYLRDRIEVGGVCPSHKEMMDHIGTRSKSSIAEILKKLENEGLIYMPEHRARSISLTSSRSVVCTKAMVGIEDPVGFVKRAKFAGVIQ